MGANNSKTMQSTASFVANSVFNSVIKTQNIQQTAATVNQSQTIDVSTDPNVLLACIQILGPSGYDCSKLMSNGTFSDVSQVATYNITATTQLSDSDTTSVQNQLTSAITAKMADTSDDVGAALKSIATAAGGNNSSSATLNQSVSELVTNNFTKDTVNKMISSYASGQSQVLKVTNSNSTVSGFSQSLQVQALTQMVTASSTLSAAVTKADSTSTSTSTSQEKGLTDIVEDIGNTIGGAFSDLSSVGKTLVIGGVACVLIIPLIVLSLGKSGAIKTAGDVANHYVDKMPVAVPV